MDFIVVIYNTGWIKINHCVIQVVIDFDGIGSSDSDP